MARGRGDSVGKVSVDIVADGSHFSREITKARTRLQRFRDRAVRIAKRIASSWKLIAAAVAGVSAAIVVSLKKMADYSSSLVEASRTTGMAIKQLESLRTLFQGDGIGIQRTDKAMQEFTVRVGYAQRGIGEYTRAFEELGIKVRNADGSTRDHNKLLVEVAGKLASAGSHAQAASLAYELFGRAGKEILPILLKYGENLGKAAEHANRFNTVTGEGHEAAKAMGQSFTDLKNKSFDLLSNALQPMVPVAEELTKTLIDSMEQLEPFAVKFGGVVATIIKGWGDLAKWAAPIVGLDLRETERKIIDAQTEMAEIDQRIIEIKNRRQGESVGAGRGGDSELNRLKRKRQELEDQIEVWKEEQRLQEAVDRMMNPVTTSFSDSTEGDADDKVSAKLPYTLSGPGAPFPLTRDQHRFLRGFRDARELNDYKRRKADMGARHLLRYIPPVVRLRSAEDPQMAFGNRWPEMLPPSYPLGGQAYAQSLRQQFTEVSNSMVEWAAKTLKDRLTMAAPSSMVPSGAVGMPTEILPPMMEWAAKTLADRSKMAAPSSMIPSGPVAMPTEVLEPMTEWAGKTLAERLKVPTPSSVPQGEIDEFLKKFMPTEVLEPMTEWAAKTLKERLRVAAPSSVIGSQDYTSQLLANRGQYSDIRGRWYGPETLQRMNADGLKKPLKDITTFAMEARQSFMSLGDAIVDNFQNAGEALRQFARDLLKIGLRRTIMNPIANSLFGAEDGSTTGLFGGLLNSFESLGSGAGMSMGAKGVTIINNINSTDGPGVERALANAMPGFVATAQSTIMDNSNRYGQTQRMIRGTR